jgi:ABC-2 type transport system ATP-binding protein
MNVGVRPFLAGVVAVAALVGAPAASARDAIVTSFDGAPISASFFAAEGLAPGQKAPTILETHGWGATRDKDESSATLAAVGQVGLGPLRRAGFNVLTWDSRGFGESGGDVEVDSHDFEGRDVSALLNRLATQPEQRLDGAGDPRAGMTGASYAGGIELVAAAVDHRIDAIAPDIAWHSLLTALYRDDIVKGGWAAALSGLGIPTATALGVISPAGVQGAASIRTSPPRSRRGWRPVTCRPRTGPGSTAAARATRSSRASACRPCSCRARLTRSSRPARRSATRSC